MIYTNKVHKLSSIIQIPHRRKPKLVYITSFKNIFRIQLNVPEQCVSRTSFHSVERCYETIFSCFCVVEIGYCVLFWIVNCEIECTRILRDNIIPNKCWVYSLRLNYIVNQSVGKVTCCSWVGGCKWSWILECFEASSEFNCAAKLNFTHGTAIIVLTASYLASDVLLSWIWVSPKCIRPKIMVLILCWLESSSCCTSCTINCLNVDC